MVLSERHLRMLCLALLVLCVSFAGASCRKQEQEQRRAFIEFLETHVLAETEMHGVLMDETTRKQVGIYGRHFDVIATYARELSDIHARLAG
jgi:hypothetical protein